MLLAWLLVTASAAAGLGLVAPPRARAAAGTGPPSLHLQTVFPSTPGQNQVRWWEFDWKWSDFVPVPDGAPVRLYFYDSEIIVAQLVKPFIADAYREYTERFHYRPRHRIPFLLYNSHFEFESTTAFFISEGVLGVTSTEDLTMALPYWGERARFEHVMRHELAHQFAIQKVRDEVGPSSGCNPTELLPLWFQEGLAEFFSQPTLGAEVVATLADRLLGGKQRPRGLPGFFDDSQQGFERVYLLGHAQVAFLEEVYGTGTIVRLLERAPRVCVAYGAASSAVSPFETLIANVTGATAKEVEARWHAWTEDKVAPLRDARQSVRSLTLVEGLGRGEVDSFSLSPDGRTIFYRILDPDTGVSSLYLRDLDDPHSRRFITDDRRPSLETLHPLDRRVTAIGADRLVYIGRRGRTDRIFVRPFRREVGRDGRVRYSLGSAVEHDLAEVAGLIEAGSPAIDPRTGAVAFSALSRETGFLDIFRIDEPLARRARMVRLTNDAYAETGLTYTPAGELVYASDATRDARAELMRMAAGADPRDPDQLTHFANPAEAIAPAPGLEGGGGLVFQADPEDRLQAYRLGPGDIARITDVPTWFEQPTLDASGGLLGIALADGHRAVARIPRERWLDEAVDAKPVGPREPWTVPQATLENVQRYDPLAARNYSLAAIQAAIAGGPIILGQLAFTDLFKARLVGLEALVLGSWSRSDLRAFYLDQSGRWTVGGSVFFETTPQFAVAPGGGLLTEDFRLQRIGADFQFAYPFGRYTRFEGYVSPQLLSAFAFSGPTPGSFAGHWPALRLGAGYVIDTLRQSLFGPVSGQTFSLSGESTFAFGGPAPFGTVQAEYRAFQPVLRLTDRVFLSERLAAAASLGQRFAEQFFVPAAYNLRALPDDSDRQIGSYFYLAQLEGHFPLTPVVFGFLYLQGVVGADLGAVFITRDQALRQRVAAGVLGFDVGFGPLTLRFQWARPIDIGAGVPFNGWLFHLSIVAPGLLPF